MNKKKIYNPDSTERTSERKLFGGDPTGIFELNDIKYQWAYNLWEVMLNNSWYPKEVDMTQDVLDYKRLSDSEKTAYDKVLAQLIFMDSIQTNNLVDNMNPFITSPEVNLILVRHAFEEALHAQSYAVMVDSISQNSKEIYDLWRKDAKLKSKNDAIAKTYSSLSEDPTDENIIKAMFANQILEGIYFYSGFAYIYTLARSGKMLGSAQMIRFIQRDENCLHPNTDILTSTGWKNIEHVTERDLVAQYDLGTEVISFANPLAKIWKDYSGDMLKVIDARGKVVQHITSDHDMVVKSTKTKKSRKEKACNSKFNGNKHIPCSGHGGGEIDRLSDYDRLLIAISADGHIDRKRHGINSGHQIVRFGVKKERKKIRILELLKSSNTNYKEIDGEEDCLTLCIMIPLDRKLDKIFNWVELDKVSSGWCQEFMSELVKWDGHIPEDRDSLYYSSTREEEFNKVLAICSMSGYKFKTNVQKDDRSDKFSDVYRLTWWTHTNGLDTQSMRKESYSYNGKVGCVTMPKGTIITKHDGQVCVTGNCHLALFQNMIRTVKREKPEFFTKEFMDEIYTMFREGVDLEVKWGKHITDGNILGLTDNIIEQYIQHLADNRLSAVGFDKIYNVENPIKWVDGFSKFNDQKTNFFEGNVTNYSKGSLDLDDF